MEMLKKREWVRIGRHNVANLKMYSGIRPEKEQKFQAKFPLS
jgi:hypothetical protein